MIEKLVLPEIRELLAGEDHATLAGVLNSWLPADLAGPVASARRRALNRLLEGAKSCTVSRSRSSGVKAVSSALS